ncbi:MAG: hypothetical protein RMK79_03310 [Anaerolineae bacterium]|nr:hypothetical protein [Anaerolineae bacterium]
MPVSQNVLKQAPQVVAKQSYPMTRRHYVSIFEEVDPVSIEMVVKEQNYEGRFYTAMALLASWKGVSQILFDKGAFEVEAGVTVRIVSW